MGCSEGSDGNPSRNPSVTRSSRTPLTYEPIMTRAAWRSRWLTGLVPAFARSSTS
jgi:hypothetical protein